MSFNTRGDYTPDFSKAPLANDQHSAQLCSPLILDAHIHQIRVSHRVHGGNQDVLNFLGHGYLCSFDEVIPVLPDAAVLLLLYNIIYKINYINTTYKIKQYINTVYEMKSNINKAYKIKQYIS